MADTRLEFLKASAHLYATTAPATAAHLMLQFAKVAEDNGRGYDEGHFQDACRACGTIAVVDRTVQVSLVEDQNAGKQLKAPMTKPSEKLRASPQASKFQETECLVCHRVTRVSAAKNKSRSQDHSAKQQTIHSTSNAPGQLDAAVHQQSTNLCLKDPKGSGTKQRAKARKRGGLQAMVERSKGSQNTAFASGLDLMDLMKAG